MAEPEQAEVKQIYHELLSALPASAVGRGRAELLDPRAAWSDNPTAQHFVLVQWQTQPSEFDLVAVNLAPHRSQCRVSLRLPELACRDWNMKDRLGEEQYLRAGRELEADGLFLDLPPHGAQLFSFSPATK